MALNSPFSGRIKKNSVDDLDGEMEERRRLIEEAVADLRAKQRYARGVRGGRYHLAAVRAVPIMPSAARAK
jgi:hypothetical protein